MQAPRHNLTRSLARRPEPSGSSSPGRCRTFAPADLPRPTISVYRTGTSGFKTRVGAA